MREYVFKNRCVGWENMCKKNWLLYLDVLALYYKVSCAKRKLTLSAPTYLLLFLRLIIVGVHTHSAAHYHKNLFTSKRKLPYVRLLIYYSICAYPYVGVHTHPAAQYHKISHTSKRKLLYLRLLIYYSIYAYPYVDVHTNSAAHYHKISYVLLRLLQRLSPQECRMWKYM